MDPFVVFDCQKVLPNRFMLALAATSRARALNHGHTPRIEPPPKSSPVGIALSEISASAFDADEIAPFVAIGADVHRLTVPRAQTTYPDATQLQC